MFRLPSWSLGILLDLIHCQFLNIVVTYRRRLPTWTGNILHTYKVYREERVQIRHLEIACRMLMYDNLQY